MPRYSLEPTHRTAKERSRSHQGARITTKQRLQHTANQAHVVVDGQPTHAVAVRAVFECVTTESGIVKQEPSRCTDNHQTTVAAHRQSGPCRGRWEANSRRGCSSCIRMRPEGALTC